MNLVIVYFRQLFITSFKFLTEKGVQTRHKNIVSLDHNVISFRN